MVSIFEQTGTINVTNGSRAVSGTGTGWLSSYDGIALNIRGASYPVESIDSATALTLVKPYPGATQTAQEYTFLPLQPTNYQLSKKVKEYMDVATELVDVASNAKASDTNAVGGRPATDILNTLDLNGSNILREALRLDATKAVVDGLREIDREPIAAYIKRVNAALARDITTVTDTVSLALTKNAAGMVVLRGDQVQVAGTGVEAKTLTSIATVVADHETKVARLFETVFNPGNSTGRGLLRVEPDGTISGFDSDLTGEVASANFFSDAIKISQRGGSGQARTVFTFGIDGVLEALDLRVRTLVPNAVTVKNVAAGFSGTQRYTAADVAIGSAETTIIETPLFALGSDGVAGNALAVIGFVSDSTNAADTAVRFRIFLDTGSGYALSDQMDIGLRSSSGDTRRSNLNQWTIPVSATDKARIKVTLQGIQLAGAGNTSGSFARNIQINMLRVGR
jgi:hypothetical protein